MPLKAYRDYQALKVMDTPNEFYERVCELLDQLAALHVGYNLLFEMNGSGKELGIAPFRQHDSGNKCVAHNPKRFVLLRQAFMKIGEVSIATELTKALTRAEKAGLSRDRIAELLASELPPATVRTTANVAPVVMKVKEKDVTKMRTLLDDLASGKTTSVPSRSSGYAVDDKLVRILRHWTDKGGGSSCGIYFDPNIVESCVGDTMAKRPPAVGLAHELCHAWRNMTGLRLFDDAQACGFDDDEVMTTGIPPYSNERYSENLFRSQWPVAAWNGDVIKTSDFKRLVPMRENYR
jgi:hypothetical protein